MKQTNRIRPFTAQFFRGNRLNALTALAMSVLLAAANLPLSWLLQQITDFVAGSGAQPLSRLVLYTVAGILILVPVHMVYRTVYPRFLARAMAQYKQYLFREITKKNISTFSRENTSRYLSALTNDAASIETNYLDGFFTMVELVIYLVGAVAMMLWYSPLLTAAALALSPLPILASALTGSRLTDAEKQVSAENERFVGTVKDLLSGFTVIKSFRAETEAQRLFLEKNEAAEACKCRRKTTEQTITVFASAASITAQLGTFLVAAWLAGRGMGITPGMVVVFLQLVGLTIEPIRQLPKILANRRAARALIEKMADALEEDVTTGGEAVGASLEQDITLEHITCGYDAEKPVLKDLSVTFEAGKRYAIVGPSGSGKSTLLNLLTGGAADYDGEVRFDGRELRGLDRDSLCDLISMVQQNVFVFNDTIRNNITMFREFPQEAVDSAIRRAGLSALIEAKGEDYVCGENGCGLSGGERQRISIARCLLRGTPVMLIDEATAALDKQTAAAVMDAILDIGGLTRIAVTHQLEEALLSRFDQILVLRGGQICERGTFGELMDRRGLFYSLYTVSQS